MAPRRSYKLLSNNTKGIRVCNIIIANSLELNAAGYFYRCPITYIYNFNICLSNISK